MIDDINTREKGHILAIEDPIEFVHTRKNCLISQREIEIHAASFSSALLSALREDPDVVLVGELRDTGDHEHRGSGPRRGDRESWSWAPCTRTAPRPPWTAS